MGRIMIYRIRLLRRSYRLFGIKMGVRMSLPLLFRYCFNQSILERDDREWMIKNL